MFLALKRQLKLLTIATLCFVGLYGAETFLHESHFSSISSLFASPHPPHPLNTILHTPVEEITLQQAKDLFDSTFKDRTGYSHNFSNWKASDQKLKLIKVFEEKGDLETQFYLGRMLCISTFSLSGAGLRLEDPNDPTKKNHQNLNNAIKQLAPDNKSMPQKSAAISSHQLMGRTDKQVGSDFLRGLKILIALAEKNYHPAQLYIGVTTLEPKGMFDSLFLRNLTLPSTVRISNGNRNYCERTLFDPKEIASWNNMNSINKDDPLIRPFFITTIYATNQSKSNGYGLTYAQAIQHLESAGHSGLTEAWTILDRYFTRISGVCSKERGPDYYYSQYKTAMYKKKCEQHNVCEVKSAKQ